MRRNTSIFENEVFKNIYFSKTFKHVFDSFTGTLITHLFLTYLDSAALQFLLRYQPLNSELRHVIQQCSLIILCVLLAVWRSFVGSEPLVLWRPFQASWGAGSSV